MKRMSSIVLGSVLAVLAGCSGSNPLVGKYNTEQSDKFELELIADGTYKTTELMNTGTKSLLVRGRYQVNGNTITFHPEWQDPVFGTEMKSYTATIDGNTLVAGATRYIKQAGSSNAVATGTNQDPKKLTKDKVQRALDTALAPHKQGGTATILGIQENSQDNSARADIRFDSFQYNAAIVGMQDYSGQGFAILSHYNDGRWVLVNVHIKTVDSIATNVEVQ